jgi:hypothetical protein
MSLTDERPGDETVNCGHCGHEVGTNGSVETARPIFDAEPEDQAFAVLMRSALTRKIHVNCGSCGRGLKVSLRMAGRKTTCPACGQRVRLPLAGQESERRIEELIAKRSPQVLASETEVPPAKADAPSLMHFDKSELAELATYVETDGSDETTLEISEEDDDLMHRSSDAMEGREILALNAAISASSHARGKSAAEELPALQKAVREHAPLESEGMSGQTKAIIITVAAALLVGVGLWMAMTFFGGSQTDPDPNGATVHVDPGADTPKIKDPVKPPKIKPPKVKPIPPKSVKVIAVCKAVTASTDSFAGNGFFPAGPGQVFCRIRIQVKAGDDKLEVSNYGKAALLKIGLDSYPSLGEPVKSILPTPPRRMRLSLPAHGTKTLTMLFQLPQKALAASGATAAVVMGKMAPVSVRLGSSAHVLPAKAVTGDSKAYVEVAPRNTKPLLSDPVMSAIQSTTPQKLSILPGTEADSVKLKLGSGEVTGTAVRDARGLYVTKLTHNGSTLQCLLRFAHGGREAILYLSEEPFHQLTFAQPGWSRTVPIVPQGPASIQPKGNPKPKPPIGPDPTPVRPRPRPTNSNGRRPGFFGV